MNRKKMAGHAGMLRGEMARADASRDDPAAVQRLAEAVRRVKNAERTAAAAGKKRRKSASASRRGNRR